MRLFVAQINLTIGDIVGNGDKIVSAILQAKKQSADIILFSELTICGYPPEDFLLLPAFILAIEEQLQRIIANSKNIAIVVGLPRRNLKGEGKILLNSAAIISDGQLLGFYDKMLLPTYDVFDEKRYFEPGQAPAIWTLAGKKVGVTICEDVWEHSGYLLSDCYHQDPVVELSKLKPELMLNLSASPFSFNKPNIRENVCIKASISLGCPVVLCNQVGGNDSLIFDGHSLFIGADGQLLHVAKGFKEDFLCLDVDSQVPHSNASEVHRDSIANLYHALVLGVRDYFHKLGFTKACLGLSGGIDSAVVAVVAASSLGNENILGVGMPSRYSSEGSIVDAKALAKNLGIHYQQIPIELPFDGFLDLLIPNFENKEHGVAEENLQARIRGTILMTLSNKLGYIVLSTGNKSELAIGYSTLYGDMCGGLGVLSDVSKEKVYELARWINRNNEIIPLNTITKPPSAELRPNQKDSDSLPDYVIIDNVIREYVEEHNSPDVIAKKYGYSLSLVNDLVRRIHLNEYKRRQGPLGLRVTEKAFFAGRRFPIVQRWVV